MCQQVQLQQVGQNWLWRTPHEMQHIWSRTIIIIIGRNPQLKFLCRCLIIPLEKFSVFNIFPCDKTSREKFSACCFYWLLVICQKLGSQKVHSHCTLFHGNMISRPNSECVHTPISPTIRDAVLTTWNLCPDFLSHI